MFRHTWLTLASQHLFHLLFVSILLSHLELAFDSCVNSIFFCVQDYHAVDILLAEIDVYELFAFKHCVGRRVQLALCKGTILVTIDSAIFLNCSM